MSWFLQELITGHESEGLDPWAGSSRYLPSQSRQGRGACGGGRGQTTPLRTLVIPHPSSRELHQCRNSETQDRGHCSNLSSPDLLLPKCHHRNSGRCWQPRPPRKSEHTPQALGLLPAASLCSCPPRLACTQ